MTTLAEFCLGLPELGGRVFLDTAPSTPLTPYAVVYDAPGGVSESYYGGADTLAVYPSVTVYHKPAAGKLPAQARLELMAIMTKLQQAHKSVNLHSDGLTPFFSIERASEFTPLPDRAVPGQSYATVRFQALIYRS